MIKIFLELITRNFIALSYLKAENINKKLLNEKIINFKIGNEKQIAELIYKSLVSYHSPWRKVTSKYNVIFNSKGVFNDDILNGLSNAPEFSIYQYSRRVNRHIVNSFFPGERLSHFNYLNKDELILFEKFINQKREILDFDPNLDDLSLLKELIKKNESDAIH